MEVFGVIRSLMAFRLTGGTKGEQLDSNSCFAKFVCTDLNYGSHPVILDYVVVGSDSGRIVILEYHPSKNMFEKIHQETFGKSGCRRIVPGQFLAVDPKGRAVMIGKKQRLCVVKCNCSQAGFSYVTHFLFLTIHDFYIPRCH